MSSSDSIGISILIQVQKEKDDDDVSWYIIRETSIGPQMSEIFRSLPQEVESFKAPLNRNCVFVGPKLYNIGGSNSFLQFSNRIRVLDTRNPSDGWKTDELPFYCAGALTAVSGNFIYLFTGGYTSSLTTADPKAPSPWGYVYDTFNGEAYELKPPIGNHHVPGPPFIAPSEGQFKGFLVVPVIDRKSQETFFYFHDPFTRHWRQYQHIKPPHSANVWGPFCNAINESPLSVFWNKPHATNGLVYYVLCGPYIHAFDIYPWNFVGSILMPKLSDIDHCVDSVFMFFVPKKELRIVWHTPYPYSCDRTSTIHCASIFLSLFPTPKATLLKQVEFNITAFEVFTCLPYFSADYSNEGEDDCLHTRETQVQERSFDASNSKQNKHELQEVDWKERCMYLEEELQRLKQQSHSTQTCRAATTDQPPYKKIKEKVIVKDIPVREGQVSL